MLRKLQKAGEVNTAISFLSLIFLLSFFIGVSLVTCSVWHWRYPLIIILIICPNTSVCLCLKHHNAWFEFHRCFCFWSLPNLLPYMPHYRPLTIMPKERNTSISIHTTSAADPYPATGATSSRNAAIWSTADDEILLQARSSGLNWQPIASRHFPNKTANACRKRHERLVERRHVEDWDTSKLELLAHEYMACRKEMWEILATRLGERWGVIEAKVSQSMKQSLPILTRHRSAWKRV